MLKWERHLQISLAIANTPNSNTHKNDGDQLQHQWQLHLLNTVEVSFKSTDEDLRTFRTSNSKSKTKQKQNLCGNSELATRLWTVSFQSAYCGLLAGGYKRPKGTNCFRLQCYALETVGRTYHLLHSGWNPHVWYLECDMKKNYVRFTVDFARN